MSRSSIPVWETPRRSATTSDIDHASGSTTPALPRSPTQPLDDPTSSSFTIQTPPTTKSWLLFTSSSLFPSRTKVRQNSSTTVGSTRTNRTTRTSGTGRTYSAPVALMGNRRSGDRRLDRGSEALVPRLSLASGGSGSGATSLAEHGLDQHPIIDPSTPIVSSPIREDLPDLPHSAAFNHSISSPPVFPTNAKPPPRIRLPTPSEQSLLLSLKREDQRRGIASLGMGERMMLSERGGGIGLTDRADSEQKGVHTEAGSRRVEGGKETGHIETATRVATERPSIPTVNTTRYIPANEALTSSIDPSSTTLGHHAPSESIARPVPGGWTISDTPSSAQPELNATPNESKQENTKDGQSGGRLWRLGSAVYGYAVGSGTTGQGMVVAVPAPEVSVETQPAMDTYSVEETAPTAAPDAVESISPQPSIPMEGIEINIPSQSVEPLDQPKSAHGAGPGPGSTWWNYVPIYGRTSSQPIVEQVQQAVPETDVPVAEDTEMAIEDSAMNTESTAKDAALDNPISAESMKDAGAMEEQVRPDIMNPESAHDRAGWSGWRPWTGRSGPLANSTGTTSTATFESATPDMAPSPRLQDVETLIAPQGSIVITTQPDVDLPRDVPSDTKPEHISRTAWLMLLASQAAQLRRSAAIPAGVVADSPMTGVMPIAAAALPKGSTISGPTLDPAAHIPAAPPSSSPGSRSIFGMGRNRQPAPGPSRPNRIVPAFKDIFGRPPRLAPRPDSTPPTSVETNDDEPEVKAGWQPWSLIRRTTQPASERTKDASDAAAPAAQPKEEPDRLYDPRLPKLVHEGKESWIGIRRVVVVGVHGWFPQVSGARSMLGDPRKSAYYASMMGSVVTSLYEDDHGIGEQDLERITYIHLDGDGTIDIRVEALYRQFLARPDWIIDMRKADAVFFVGHSQGCIVAAHIMAKMLADGHLRAADARPASAETFPSDETTAKIGFLAICGIHVGPLHYPGLTTVMQPYLWFESAAARELFDFQDTSSSVSVAYQEAMSAVLSHGVKVVLLASLDDQVVPIYGALFSSADHPNILRTLHVDGAVQPETDFMVHLLTFCLSLRNAGIDDQGLLEHLSEAVAGELRGAGHSSPGEDPGGYETLVRYLLGTDTPELPEDRLEVTPFNIKDRNEYELPWILRGVMDDPAIKELFVNDIKTLKDSILDWEPTTKALTQIKKRLEPMAGRAALRNRKDKRGRLTPSPSTLSLRSQVCTDQQKSGLGGGDW